MVIYRFIDKENVSDNVDGISKGEGFLIFKF